MSRVGLVWPRSSLWFSVPDIVTGMRFTYDCKHLITVSGDRYPSARKAPILLQPCSVGYGGGFLWFIAPRASQESALESCGWGARGR